MSSTVSPASDYVTTNPVETPPPGSDPEELKKFLNKRVRYDSALKLRRDSKNTRASLYRQAQQWLQQSGWTDPSKTSAWSPVQLNPESDDWIPTPVQPEIVGCLQNESARLGKPDYAPYVRPQGENPTAEDREGSRLAEQALKHRLREMYWSDSQADGLMHMPLWGQWIIKSYWEEDWLQTVRPPVLGGMCCPRHEGAQVEPPQEPVPTEQLVPPDGTDEIPQFQPDGMPTECDFCLSTPEVPAGADISAVEGMEAILQPFQKPGKGGVAITAFRAARCPKCPDHPELVPYYPTMEEAAEGEDSIGRPLGEEQAIGDWRLRNVSPYDFFPASQGIGIDSFRDLPYWTEVYAVPVAWVSRHFRDGERVKPENSQSIAQWHPIAGEKAVMLAGSYGDETFSDFVRVKEYCERPSRKYPRGRYIALSGDTVLADGDFMLQGQNGQLYERVHYDLVSWEPLPHQIWGLSLSELLFSLQDSINEVRSMEEDRRSRMGVMGISATRGMNLDCEGFDSGGGSGKRYVWDVDPMAPGQSPSLFGGANMPEATNLIQFFGQSMLNIAGTAEVENGGAPPGVAAALALQFLAEKSGERRAPRIRRIREMLERLYTHGLTLIYNKYLEDRTIDYEDEGDEWKTRSFKGVMLNGQVRVRINAEPEHDTRLQRKQLVQDLLAQGFWNTGDPKVRDLLTEILEVPDLGSELGVQREGASREYCMFRDAGEPPVVDPSLDDHQAHYDQHGHDMHSPWWHDLEKESGWNTVLPVLYNWEPDFPALSQQFVAALPFVPGLEYQILGVWKQLLLMRGIDITKLPDKQSNALNGVLRFRAHHESHKMSLQQSQQAAAAGAQVPAAPESPTATPEGTVPGPDSAPEPIQQAAVGMAPQVSA